MPLGNSASTPFAWYVGYWNPRRTMAVVSLKGASFSPPPFDSQADAREVPALAIVGEYYEWPTVEKSRLVRWLRDRDAALRMRNEDGRELLTLFVDVSRGHFDWTNDLAPVLAMYIRKVAQWRLPKQPVLDGPVPLEKIDPRSGWLVDSNTVLAHHVPPAPYEDYTGDRTKAVWAFDQEMAETFDRYAADQKTKAYQMVAFTQDGKALDDLEKGTVEIRFEPNENDEMVFKLAGTYLEQTPAALPNQPALLGHSNRPIEFLCMGGPVVQTASDTFRLRFNRFYPRAPTVIELLAYSAGDDDYRMALQPGHIKLAANQEGRPQTITFLAIPNQSVGAKSLQLQAKSDARLPVEFYVKYGPAEVEGNRLLLGQIPPRSKLPIEVCVVAYQSGRMREPRVQAARSIERVFLIDRGN
jgi:hypothetical protein